MRGLKIHFRGKDYLVPATRVFDVADQIEDVVTISALPAVVNELKITKLAKIAGIILRAAGLKGVTDQDVYAEMKAERDGLLKAATSGAAPVMGEHLLIGQVMRELTRVLFEDAPEIEPGEDHAGNRPSAS
jgi:Ribonuclease G/E